MQASVGSNVLFVQLLGCRIGSLMSYFLRLGALDVARLLKLTFCVSESQVSIFPNIFTALCSGCVGNA